MKFNLSDRLSRDTSSGWVADLTDCLSDANGLQLDKLYFRELKLVVRKFDRDVNTAKENSRLPKRGRI